METVRQTGKKSIRKPVMIAAFILILISIAILAISIYIGLQLTHPKREEILITPANYQLDYEDIAFKNIQDGITLHGWWMPAVNENFASKKTVIFAHGYADSRTMQQIEALQLAKRLVSEGYNVLAFDFRASGESEGEIVSLGQFEQFDLLSAIDYVKEEKESTEISLLGWSMGAATVILTGEKSNDVTKIIADSPYHDLSSYLKKNLPHWSNLPAFPFTPVILTVIPGITGMDPNTVSPVNAVSGYMDKSLYLIHSKTDSAVPYESSEIIYDAFPSKSNVELWLTEGGGHIESYLTDKEEYEERLLAFLRE